MQATTVPLKRIRAGLAGRLLASSGFALFTALAAVIAIPLWFTPVPITLQVLAALLAGLVLGPRLGAISQLEYLALGAAGFPVFAGGKAGVAALAGPTGGYLVGLVALAFVTGFICDRFPRRRQFGSVLASLAGILAIYVIGAGWLAVWMSVVSGNGQIPSFSTVFAAGVAPFILIDLVKVGICSLVWGSGKRLFARISAL
jgi:biotin transport system substrate-specific component